MDAKRSSGLGFYDTVLRIDRDMILWISQDQCAANTTMASPSRGSGVSATMPTASR